MDDSTSSGGRAPVPILDPDELNDYEVFREAFLCKLEADAALAFRAFARHLFGMVLESTPFWHGTSAEATAHDLRATIADLRFLQGHLQFVGFSITENETERLSPRDKRWQRFALRMALRIGRMADEIEKELTAGLEEIDHS